jgi:hypothetical protein
MAFFDKLNELASQARDKTADVIETQKLNSKIGSEKSAISDVMKKIGEYYYGKYAAGEAADPAIAEMVTEIDAHIKAIQDVEAQLRAIKDEAPAQPSPQSQPAAQGKTCPACGAALKPDVRFCGECGAKLE